MDERKEKRTPFITMRHIRALAGKRGYRVNVNEMHISIMKKNNEQIRCSFDLHDSFKLDPPWTQPVVDPFE